MMRNIRRRLRGRAGETIAEVLVATLISVIALAMLAAMIRTASSMIMGSEDSMKAYYQENSGLANQTTAKGTATVKVTMDGTTVIAYGAATGGLPVNYYENSAAAGEPVRSYRLQTGG